MVKTNKNSLIVLWSLEQIRETRHVILQIEDTGAYLDSGKKCFLCEIVSSGIYNSIRNESDLVKEICTLNTEKRKLEKKVARLEKALAERTGK